MFKSFLIFGILVTLSIAEAYVNEDLMGDDQSLEQLIKDLAQLEEDLPLRALRSSSWKLRAGKRGDGALWKLRTGKREALWKLRSMKRDSADFDSVEVDNSGEASAESFEGPAAEKRDALWKLRSMKRDALWKLRSGKRDPLWKLRTGKRSAVAESI